MAKKLTDLYHIDEQVKHFVDIDVDLAVHAKIKNAPSIMFRYVLKENFNLPTIKAAMTAYQNGSIIYHRWKNKSIWVSCRLNREDYDRFREICLKNRLGTIDYVSKILLLYICADEK